MAEVLEVSRSEVQRWLDAGTLGVCETITGLDKDYYLVACTAYEKDWSSWTPAVGRTMDTESDAEYWSNIMPDEMVDEIYGHVFCNCFEVWHLVDDQDTKDDSESLPEFPRFNFNPRNVFIISWDSVDSHSGLYAGSIAIVRRREYFSSDWDRVKIDYEVLVSSRNLSYVVLTARDLDLTDFHLTFDMNQMCWCLVDDEIWIVRGTSIFISKYETYEDKYQIKPCKSWFNPYKKLGIELMWDDCGIAINPYVWYQDYLTAEGFHHPIGYDARDCDELACFSWKYFRDCVDMPFTSLFTFDSLCEVWSVLGRNGYCECIDDEDSEVSYYTDARGRSYCSDSQSWNDGTMQELRHSLEELRAASVVDRIKDDKPIKRYTIEAKRLALPGVYDKDIPF